MLLEQITVFGGAWRGEGFMAHTEDPKIDLGWGGNGPTWYGVGFIRFPRSPSPMQANKSVDGLALTIPTLVQVTKNDAVAKRIMLSQLQAVVTQDGVELGVAHDANFYVGPMHRPNSGELILRLPGHVVRRIEHVRAGGIPEFALQIRAELCLLESPQDGGRDIRTEPLRVVEHVRVSYEKDVWVEMLNRTGFGENVVVEIPLPPSPNPDWAPIYEAVATAREALKRGGGSAWKTVIVECRLALETWQKLDSVDCGSGWRRPPQAELIARTHEQRLDNLRFDLLQCAHEAAHTPADKWTHDDAVLVLATLAGLLAIRHP